MKSYLKMFKWVLIWLVARIGTLIIGTISMLYTIVRYVHKPKVLEKYFRYSALSIDQHASVICNDLLFDTMIKKCVWFKALEFDTEDMTISSILAENNKRNTLNKFGLFWVWFLNKVDPGHISDETASDKDNFDYGR